MKKNYLKVTFNPADMTLEQVARQAELLREIDLIDDAEWLEEYLEQNGYIFI